MPTLFTATSRANPDGAGWTIRCDQAATSVTVLDLVQADDAMRLAIAAEFGVDSSDIAVTIRLAIVSPGLRRAVECPVGHPVAGRASKGEL